MPNAGTGGGEAGEEDATGRGGPLLHVLLPETRIPKSLSSSAHTMQTWKGRGKWTNAWSAHMKSTHGAVCVPKMTHCKLTVDSINRAKGHIKVS